MCPCFPPAADCCIISATRTTQHRKKKKTICSVFPGFYCSSVCVRPAKNKSDATKVDLYDARKFAIKQQTNVLQLNEMETETEASTHNVLTIATAADTPTHIHAHSHSHVPCKTLIKINWGATQRRGRGNFKTLASRVLGVRVYVCVC